MARIPYICTVPSQRGIEAFKAMQKYDSDYLYCRCSIYPMKEKEKMEFDKSKVLTVVTADQAKAGYKGWFADVLTDLESRANNDAPDFIKNIDLSGKTRYPFKSALIGGDWSLFYPDSAPKTTYAERQAQWVKENNVKAGTKVRVTRTFTNNEDGSCCFRHDDLVGMIGVVSEDGIASHNLVVDMSDEKMRFIPYFALEVVKEPTYAERQSEWVKQNDVKIGTKVRFTRGFDDNEDGSGSCRHRDAKGHEGTVERTEHKIVWVTMDGESTENSWASPYTALEIIKETIRPFNEDELNDLVGKIVRNKQTRYRKLVTGKPNTSLGVNLEGKYICAKDLLNSFLMDDGKSPCGVKE